MRRHLVLITVGCVVFSGCVRWSALGIGHAPQFVRIAEGLTSATQSEPARVAPRMFSAPDMVKACAAARPVERLRVVPSVVVMAVDERLALSRLSVVAVNAADIVVPAVPIVFEAEDVIPAVVALRSDDPDLNEGRLHAIASGRFRLRVRSICGTAGVEAVIHGRVGP